MNKYTDDNWYEKQVKIQIEDVSEERANTILEQQYAPIVDEVKLEAARRTLRLGMYVSIEEHTTFEILDSSAFICLEYDKH